MKVFLENNGERAKIRVDEKKGQSPLMFPGLTRVEGAGAFLHALCVMPTRNTEFCFILFFFN